MRPDEFLQEGPQDFSGKRDRWAGFDPSEYDRVIEKHAKIEEERRRLKEADAEAELQRAIARIDDNVHPETGANAPLSDNEAEEEEKYAEAVDMPGQKVNTKTRMTVRNLRIREDTAKYLRNLDPESAFYDPKTRSMRENPNPDADAEEVHYIGDNFARLSGDTQRVTELQVFAWQASERGEEVSLQANPSEVERLYRLHLQQQETKKQKLSASLRARYGGDDSDDNDNDNDNSQDNRSLEAVDCDSNIDPVVACDESDVYIEYSKSGKVLKTSRGR
jgi:pre-mRNA-processing factor SLU7